MLVLDRRPQCRGRRRRGRNEDLLDLDRVGHRAPRGLQLGERREAALANLCTALGSRVGRRHVVLITLFLLLEEAAADAGRARTPGGGVSAQRGCVCVIIFSHAYARSHCHAKRRGGRRSRMVRRRSWLRMHAVLCATSTASVARRGTSLLRYVVATSQYRWRAARAHGRGRSATGAIGSLRAVGRCEPAGRRHRALLSWDVGSGGKGTAAGARSANLAQPTGVVEAGGGRHGSLHVVVAHLVARQRGACLQAQLCS